MQTGTKRNTLVDQIFGDNKAPIAEVLEADFADLRVEIITFTGKMREAFKSPPKTDEEQAALGKVILDAGALWKRADGAREAEKRPILEAGRELDAFFKDMLASLVKGRDALQGQADAYARQKAAEERARREREARELAEKAEAERRKAEAAKSAQAAANAEARAEALDSRAEKAAEAAAASEADLVRARAGGITASAKGVWKATILDYTTAISPLGAVGPYLKRDAFEAALNSMARIQGAAAVWPGVSFSPDVKANFRR